MIKRFVDLDGVIYAERDDGARVPITTRPVARNVPSVAVEQDGFSFYGPRYFDYTADGALAELAAPWPEREGTPRFVVTGVDHQAGVITIAAVPEDR